MTPDTSHPPYTRERAQELLRAWMRKGLDFPIHALTAAQFDALVAQLEAWSAGGPAPSAADYQAEVPAEAVA